jgi:hypothetical protein
MPRARTIGTTSPFVSLWVSGKGGSSRAARCLLTRFTARPSLPSRTLHSYRLRPVRVGNAALRRPLPNAARRRPWPSRASHCRVIREHFPHQVSAERVGCRGQRGRPGATSCGADSGSGGTDPSAPAPPFRSGSRAVPPDRERHYVRGRASEAATSRHALFGRRASSRGGGAQRDCATLCGRVPSGVGLGSAPPGRPRSRRADARLTHGRPRRAPPSTQPRPRAPQKPSTTCARRASRSGPRGWNITLMAPVSKPRRMFGTARPRPDRHQKSPDPGKWPSHALDVVVIVLSVPPPTVTSAPRGVRRLGGRPTRTRRGVARTRSWRPPGFASRAPIPGGRRRRH